MSGQTNLHNIVQNSDERIAILKPGRHVSFGINSQTGSAYFWAIRNSSYLDLIIPAVVRVVRAGFRCSPHWFGPEEDALCTESSDEYTLIRSRGWILLFIQKRKISPFRVNDAKGTDQVDTAVMILHGSPDVAPNETLPSVLERSPR